MADRAAWRWVSSVCRRGGAVLPLLAVGGCVSDQALRSFAASQVINSLVDVFAIFVNAFVAGLFPSAAAGG